MQRRSSLGRTVATITAVAFVFPPVDLHADDVPDVQERLLDAVQFLASDELEGRSVGSDGLNQAADYVREQFRKAGLSLDTDGGDGFQRFEMVTGSELGTMNSLEVVTPDGDARELTIDEEFRTCSFGKSDSFSGGIAFVGYAIDDNKTGYSDFDGIDVEGRAVIIMRRVPRQGVEDGPFNAPNGGISKHADLRTKVRNAVKHKAAAILFVNDPYKVRDDRAKTEQQIEKVAAAVKQAEDEIEGLKGPEAAAAGRKLKAARRRLETLTTRLEADRFDQLMKFGYGGNPRDDFVPIFHITQSAADKLLEQSGGRTLAQLETEIDSDLQPRSFVLDGWQARGQADVETVRAEVKNVIGVLDGSGPLADETVVIGAHYDHVGRGGSGGSLAPGNNDVHNGADDNASGTAGLIELARRLAGRDEPLPRRLVFIAFTGEELGLIGSARYVKEPVFPIENTVAMFNMDMIGRLTDNRLTVYGSDTAVGWSDMLSELGETARLNLTLKPEGFGPSDHSSFYAKKIPVLHLFTGTHSDYHRPSDDWDKINVDGMGRVVGLLEEFVVRTATRPDRPEYQEVKGRSNITRSGSRPYFGSIPDFGSESPGYTISGTAPDSPAAKAGFRRGDTIIRLGEHAIESLSDFDLALRKFKVGDQVATVVLRDGQKVTLEVTLTDGR